MKKMPRKEAQTCSQPGGRAEPFGCYGRGSEAAEVAGWPGLAGCGWHQS